MSIFSLIQNKSKFKIPSFCIIAPIIFIFLIGIAIFANNKEKEYTLENNTINNEIETLRTEESELKSINNSLVESKTAIEKLLKDLE
ncbi:hypothetical protein [Clostridium sp.]|uniref:hypothetical protein n=1 Tax=Clostridium sp. TaxID=1506 RepID=UPI003216BA14